MIILFIGGIILFAALLWIVMLLVEWSAQPPPQPLIHCYEVAIERPDKSQYSHICKAFNKGDAINLAQGFVNRHESGHLVVGAEQIY